MCSVIGVYLESPTQEQIETLKSLFVESGIRGLHASGYSVIRNGKVFTQKAPVPAHVFVESYFAELQPGDYTLQLIGHTRYSTSDLEYNQPIQVFDDCALAHNGVVDQRNAARWVEYGYQLTTLNDSELLYQSRYAGNEPLVEFPKATMAVCELSVEKGLRWYRNAGRPLYYVKVANGYFIMSTTDIAKRAGLKGAKRCKPGVIYTPQENAKLTTVKELIP
jgi:glutamine phosphoribosylpyrophosphate amidotransferase